MGSGTSTGTALQSGHVGRLGGAFGGATLLGAFGGAIAKIEPPGDQDSWAPELMTEAGINDLFASTPVEGSGRAAAPAADAAAAQPVAG